MNLALHRPDVRACLACISNPKIPPFHAHHRIRDAMGKPLGNENLSGLSYSREHPHRSPRHTPRKKFSSTLVMRREKKKTWSSGHKRNARKHPQFDLASLDLPGTTARLSLDKARSDSHEWGEREKRQPEERHRARSPVFGITKIKQRTAVVVNTRLRDETLSGPIQRHRAAASHRSSQSSPN